MYQYTVGLVALAHIFLLALSNVLVQYPFELFGFHTTYGAFVYPLIFLLTDLVTRLSTADNARQIIYRSMFPGLILSYLIASLIESGEGFHFSNLMTLHFMPMRIALACFVAYVVGQLLDLLIFQRYRNIRNWWSAPVISSLTGNLVDTALFFSLAFYHCSNPFLSEHWVEIGLVDLCFKITITLFAFIPFYGVVLNIMMGRAEKKAAEY